MTHTTTLFRIPRIQLLSPLLLLALLTFGCADRDLQSFRKGRAMEESAKNQSIAGTYRGSLVAARDSSYMGDISLTLLSDMRTVNSSDGLGTEIQAVLYAQLVLNGRSSVPKDFHQCQYDDVSSTLTCEDSTNTLRLKGLVGGGTFRGSIEVLGQPEYGGKLHLGLGVPAESPVSIQEKLGGSSALSDQASQVYFGSAKLLTDGRVIKFKLVMTLPLVSSDQSFNNLFTESKSIDLTLIGEAGYRLVFQNANLRQGVGTITALSSPTQDGSRLLLSCKTAPDGRSYLCDYSSGSTGLLFSQALFSPETPALPNPGAGPR